MAHFAEIVDNKVVRVIVISNEVINDNGTEREELGQAFLRKLLNSSSTFKQTSYNASFRKNYAGEGYTWDEQNDVFIPPQPFPSWTLNGKTFKWDSPVPKPVGYYVWNEEGLEWKQM